MTEALEKANISLNAVDYVVATGYGRDTVPFARESITEITCHAKGAHWVNSKTRTVIDIGGQDSKVIGMDEKGNVIDFVMNDKCAAGTGKFLDVLAAALNLPTSELGLVSQRGGSPCTISSTCTIFAESEVISLLASGESKENIVAGLHKSIAKRVASMGRQVSYREEVVFTGGVAKNIGVKKALEEEIGIRIFVPPEPQIVGALGAALLAKELCSCSDLA